MRQGTARRPPKKDRLTLCLPGALQERLDAYCLRQSVRPPYKELQAPTVARRALAWYLEMLESEEALLTSRRKRPPCVVANLAGGVRWCPEHLVTWEHGDETPECCRGDE